ncbi:PfkB family carbohydrate kinase [soil metagenome]
MMIDLLAVGHCARDEFPGEPWRLGGSALFAAVAAARLGARAALVTRVGPAEREALAERCAAERIELVALPSSVTTTFAFSADPQGRRVLRLRARARMISSADVPPRVREPRAAVFASIAHELADDLFGGVAAPTTVLAAQGYLRAWDADGTVRPRAWENATDILSRVTATVVSDEDIAGDDALAAGWAARSVVIVTRAEQGARLYDRRGVTEIPAFAAAALRDPTGAGDAFAAGLAVGLADGSELAVAARFASAVASFAVEGPGIAGLADRARVAARLDP